MTGPYIVTTKRDIAHPARLQYEVLSRRAVATLESLWRCPDCGWVMAYDDPSIQIVYCVACFREGRGDDHRCERLPLPESGGTVGPLPDGTVIEVEATTWADLTEAVPRHDWSVERVIRLAEEGDRVCQQRILDAYYARQEATR